MSCYCKNQPENLICVTEICISINKQLENAVGEQTQFVSLQIAICRLISRACSKMFSEDRACSRAATLRHLEEFLLHFNI